MATAQHPDLTSVPGYYIWSAPGKLITVQLNLDLIDRLSGEVLNGFGAIPRRGAEVGGILIGKVEGSTVRIDDFEPIACQHKRGPSYLLSESDAQGFQEAFEKLTAARQSDQTAVGYYRSNTRDQTTIGDEDRQLCERYFPPPMGVMLFIKPHVSKASTAGFLTYNNGELDTESALDFAFRRSELEGTAAPPRRPLGERPERQSASSRFAENRGELSAGDAAANAPARRDAYAPRHIEPEPTPDAIDAEPKSAKRTGWVWIPLSFIFLLLGVLLGFQAALTIYPNRGALANDPYAVFLTITPSEDNLHVKWDRRADVVLSATHGVLEITDGSYNKRVELDATQLHNGSVIYRRLTPKVRFRIEVFPKDNVSVTETAEWVQTAGVK